MPSKIGQTIQEAVQTEVKNAIITSPRFSDYRVQDFIDTGAFEAIDTELDELLNQVKNIQKTPQQTAELDKITQDINKLKSGVSQLQSSLSDPQGAIFGQVTKILDSIPAAQMAVRLLPAIGIIMAGPKIRDIIIDMLTQPGGPFDKRLRIILEKQEEQFISRLEQKRRQIGQDQVVISMFDGFGNSNGRMTTNTLAQVKATGTSNIGLNEIQIGMR